MSESRKSHQLDYSRFHKVSTTCLHTPPKTNYPNQQQQKVPQNNKQCPYHFSQPSHVCLTCRRSICLRCAITYCQQHIIHPQQQILPLLQIDLQKLTIDPRIDDIEMKLKQSQQRQQYLYKKIKKMLDQVEDNFNHLKMMLDRKKQQILQYYHEQLGNNYIGEFKKYDEQLFQRRKWLQDVIQAVPTCKSIQEIDQMADIIKKQISAQSTKSQAKTTKIILGKDKLKLQKIWSQERLQKILFEIENVSYRLKDNLAVNSTTKKKRVITEASQIHKKISPFTVNSHSPFSNIMRSSSNSRFPTGRKTDN